MASEKLTGIFPDLFGIIFDGWGCTNEHYVAIYATWVSNTNAAVRRLLSCAVQPLPDESLGKNADDFDLRLKI